MTFPHSHLPSALNVQSTVVVLSHSVHFIVCCAALAGFFSPVKLQVCSAVCFLYPHFEHAPPSPLVSHGSDWSNTSAHPSTLHEILCVPLSFEMYLNVCSPSCASNSGNNTLTFPRFDCAVVLIFSATARSVPVFSSFAVLEISTAASTYSSPLTVLVDSTYSTVSVSLLGAASTSAA